FGVAHVAFNQFDVGGELNGRGAVDLFNQAIENTNFIVTVGQFIGQMSPNETAAASYQDALHVISLRSERLTFNNLRSGLFLPSPFSEVRALGRSKVEVKTPAK